MKKKTPLFTFIMFILLTPLIVNAETTEKYENGHWTLYNENGQKLTGFQFIESHNKTCYYDKNGYMLYGQQHINGYWYLFDKLTGEMKKGFQYIKEENKTVYYDDNGRMVYGDQTIEGNDYYFDKTTGAMFKGEKIVDGGWRYYGDKGMVKSAFQYLQSGNKTVYYNKDGRMITGLYEINGTKYYFDKSTGAMKTGPVRIDDKVYCFDKDGKIVIAQGQKNILGNWYLFNENGEIQTGFQYIKEEDKTVYYDSLGRMKYGQQKIDGNWYLFDKTTGAMKTGFQSIPEQNKTVYYDEDGKMVYGYRTIDGIVYYFNETTGAMKSNFIIKDGITYYYFENGGMANDWTTIAGTKYFFNGLGHMVGKDVKKVIDVSSYQGNIDWDTVKNQGGVDGAIIRIAAGCEYEDSKLARNISELKRIGMPYGIYIYSYAENYEEGTQYANFTLDKIRQYGMNPTLGIYFDLENNGVTKYMGTNEYNNVVRGYMDTMNANGYGNLTKVYTYTSYANTALNTTYIRDLIDWIAQYYHYVTYTGKYRMWQYSSTEYIPGIEGPVDVSVMFY